MEKFTEILNSILSFGTLIGHIAIVAIIVLIIAKPNWRGFEILKKYTLELSFALAAFGTVLSLVYSNIIGFSACTFCWWQRVFLYPQIVLFAVGFWKKDRKVFDSAIILSIFGFLTAIYQYYGQMFAPSALPCSSTGGFSACAIRYFVEFGYITLPLMSATAFAGLLIFGYIEKRLNK